MDITIYKKCSIFLSKYSRIFDFFTSFLSILYPFFSREFTIKKNSNRNGVFDEKRKKIKEYYDSLKIKLY